MADDELPSVVLILVSAGRYLRCEEHDPIAYEIVLDVGVDSHERLPRIIEIEAIRRIIIGKVSTGADEIVTPRTGLVGLLLPLIFVIRVDLPQEAVGDLCGIAEVRDLRFP
ncbi:hypothetical protein [Halorubrum sp. N11]|uniref:hypothetical protein n=1 Tax=Halorubrum sp. N11 TaxID=3402276 RepID=UPI003EC12CA8